MQSVVTGQAPITLERTTGPWSIEARDTGTTKRRLDRRHGLLSRIEYGSRGIWCGPCGSSVVRSDFLRNAPNITFTTSNPNPNPGPAPTHMNFARLCSVGYVSNHTRGFYPGYYPTKNFCKFCKTFIGHLYPYPEVMCVSSVLRTHTRTSCEFCTTCVPVPGTCVSSVRSPYPCPEI